MLKYFFLPFFDGILKDIQLLNHQDVIYIKIFFFYELRSKIIERYAKRKNIIYICMYSNSILFKYFFLPFFDGILKDPVIESSRRNIRIFFFYKIKNQDYWKMYIQHEHDMQKERM